MFDWKRLHLSYERLLSKYRGLNPNQEIGLQVLNQAMNPLRYPKKQIVREIESFHLNVDLHDDWPDVEALREAFEPLSNLGFSEDAPADSVYQTAIQVRKQRLADDLAGDGKARWFYRGQRNHLWDSIPKLFRDFQARGAVSDELQLEERLQQLRAIVARIMRSGLTNDEFEAVAIAQHYSSELATRTWLLDVTASPWVALFFASDGGKTGEIGTVEYIDRTEWQAFSDSGQNELGALREASPGTILRIRNQEAFFLQAPHPQLLKDLVNRKLYFRQNDDAVFESDAFVQAINRDLIYPTTDPILPTILNLPSVSVQINKLMWEPTTSILRAPDFQTYLPIALALLDRASVEWPGEWERVSGFDWNELLAQICRLHACVRTNQDNFDHYLTTLHHLKQLVIFVLMHGQRGVPFFLKFCYERNFREDETKHTAFRQCLEAASPFWAQFAANRADRVAAWPGRS
jgi:hypothetical protein